MAIEATLSRTWRNRQLLIAGFLAAFGSWFFFDGLIRYPAMHRQYLDYQRMKDAGGENEWHGRVPEDKDEKDQTQQLEWGGTAFAGALVALGVLGLNFNRRLRSDDEAVYSERGKRVPFSAFTGVNRNKWDSKGIAIAYYENGGKQRDLVIDDYKFAGAEEILKQIEAHLASKQAVS